MLENKLQYTNEVPKQLLQEIDLDINCLGKKHDTKKVYRIANDTLAGECSYYVSKFENEEWLCSEIIEPKDRSKVTLELENGTILRATYNKNQDDLFPTFTIEEYVYRIYGQVSDNHYIAELTPYLPGYGYVYEDTNLEWGITPYSSIIFGDEGSLKDTYTNVKSETIPLFETDYIDYILLNLIVDLNIEIPFFRFETSNNYVFVSNLNGVVKTYKVPSWQYIDKYNVTYKNITHIVEARHVRFYNMSVRVGEHDYDIVEIKGKSIIVDNPLNK